MLMDIAGLHDKEISCFLSGYGSDVQHLADRYRMLIKEQIRGITEQLDKPAKMIFYSFGTKNSDVICTLIPSLKGLKPGFYKGRELSDPNQLMMGSGKVHCYVELQHDTKPGDISDLLRLASEAYQLRKKK
jgi:hypothetical protein